MLDILIRKKKFLTNGFEYFDYSKQKTFFHLFVMLAVIYAVVSAGLVILAIDSGKIMDWLKTAPLLFFFVLSTLLCFKLYKIMNTAKTMDDLLNTPISELIRRSYNNLRDYSNAAHLTEIAEIQTILIAVIKHLKWNDLLYQDTSKDYWKTLDINNPTKLNASIYAIRDKEFIEKISQEEEVLASTPAELFNHSLI